MLKNAFLFCLTIMFSIIAHAKDPQFEDYPANVYKGKNSTLKLNSNTSSFKTRFKSISNSKPNYAGHYVIDFFGCGGGCIAGMAFNVKTGATQFMPFDTLTGCYIDEEYFDQKIDFKVNSRLFIAYGSDGQADSPCLVKYYVEQNGAIKLIHTKKWH